MKPIVLTIEVVLFGSGTYVAFVDTTRWLQCTGSAAAHLKIVAD
jgi:hypothetical protein